jgi:CARDB
MKFDNLAKTLVQSALSLGLLVSSQIGQALPVTWNGWSFDYSVSGNFDGLSLTKVTYQGTSLINKISMPVMRVFYDNNICGPYADRLGGVLSPITWTSNSTIGQRQFTLDGRQWYEIGIRDQIGNYDIYQVYYLSDDGILDAHIFSKGLQCVVNHIHYPNWRIDFDVDGSPNDIMEHLVGTNYQTDNTEFNRLAGDATNHAWRVRDNVTNLYVDILPGFSGFAIPDGSTNVPVVDYSQNTVFGRLYRSTEDVGWTIGPNSQVPDGNGENIAGADLVTWYEGYLPHAAADGTNVWHSTGIRLVSSLTPNQNPPLPDMVVTAVSYNNGIFTSTIKNQGTAPTPSGKAIGVGYSVDGVYKTYGAVSAPLAAGASTTIGTNGSAFNIPSGTHTVTAKVDDVNRFVESNENNNQLSATVSVINTLMPDVVVTSVSYNNGVFTSTIQNQGTGATPSDKVIGVGYSVDGVYKTYGAISGSLAAGASVTIGTNGSPFTIPNGTHTVTAKVDDLNRFAESDETNNQLTTTVNIAGSTSSDVIVNSLTYSNGVFTSIITNQGNAATPNGVVIGVGYSVDGLYKTYGAIKGPLAAGASVTIGTNGSLFVIPSGAHTIAAHADDLNRFVESNDNNNKFQQVITVP